MIRRVVLLVCLVVAGPLVVLPAASSVAGPTSSAKTFLVLRKPFGESPRGAVFMDLRLDGNRYDLGGSVRLVGEAITAKKFETSAIRLRFLLTPVGGGDVSSGRATVTFDEPYTLAPGTTSLALTANELAQLTADLDDRVAVAKPGAPERRAEVKPTGGGFDGNVTDLRSRRATGSGTLTTVVGSTVTTAGGLLTLLGERLDAKHFRADRLRLRFVGTHDGKRRQGTVTITLTKPETVERSLERLFLDEAEIAQFYDAMAT